MSTQRPIHLELSKGWAAGTAIQLAVGAVSGAVLSFELGLLWRKSMKYTGSIIGMPFSFEGFAFFTKAICYLLAAESSMHIGAERPGGVEFPVGRIVVGCAG